MPSYRDSLHPWCIVRSFPDSHTLIVARFRRRSDAEAQLRTLQRLIPTASFCIVFDTGQHFDSAQLQDKQDEPK
ncbi:hypothetical protein H6F93_30500 [Leptolyngbya sp. FACHB-671]|nr:hypothetical protein [Leptolyngbya sp. FACHB-671]